MACNVKLPKFLLNSSLFMNKHARYSYIQRQISYQQSLNTYCTASNSQMEDSEIEKKRNVSRLPNNLRNQMKHVMKQNPRTFFNQNKQLVDKYEYGKYGKASHVNPGKMWPSVEELEEMMEDEQEWEPSLQAMLANLEAKNLAEVKEKTEKEQLVEKQMANMPKYVKDLMGKIEKREEAEKKQELKRMALKEEARDYFGYNVDPRDPRFEQMQEMKAEEEKLAKKKKKKELQKERFVQMLSRVAAPDKETKNTSPATESKSSEKLVDRLI